MTLNLSVDEVLTTTRSVRKRLDLEKPVPREVLLECLDLALQAPTGSNAQGWQWVFVEDADKKKALADIYRTNATPYLDQPKPQRGDIRDQQIGARGELGEIPQRAPARGAGHAGTLSGGSARRRARRANRRILGLTAACGVESHVGTALPRPRIGLDDTASAAATARSRPPRSSASRSTSTARAGCSRSPTPRAPTSGRPSGCRSTRSRTGTAGELSAHSAPANPCCRHAS